MKKDTVNYYIVLLLALILMINIGIYTNGIDLVKIIPPTTLQYDLSPRTFIPAVQASEVEHTETLVDRNTLVCLTQNLYYEARGESDKGIIAVGNVTLNRVKSKHFPDSVCKVVFQKHQFSWTAKNRKITDLVSYHKCIDIAKKLLTGKITDITDHATHFHTKKVKPNWSYKLQRTGVVQNHIFYKFKKS